MPRITTAQLAESQLEMAEQMNELRSLLVESHTSESETPKPKATAKVEDAGFVLTEDDKPVARVKGYKSTKQSFVVVSQNVDAKGIARPSKKAKTGWYGSIALTPATLRALLASSEVQDLLAQYDGE